MPLKTVHPEGVETEVDRWALFIVAVALVLIRCVRRHVFPIVFVRLGRLRRWNRARSIEAPLGSRE